jgi:hypothetical protein
MHMMLLAFIVGVLFGAVVASLFLSDD